MTQETPKEGGLWPFLPHMRATPQLLAPALVRVEIWLAHPGLWFLLKQRQRLPLLMCQMNILVHDNSIPPSSQIAKAAWHSHSYDLVKCLQCCRNNQFLFVVGEEEGFFFFLFFFKEGCFYFIFSTSASIPPFLEQIPITNKVTLQDWITQTVRFPCQCLL